MKKIIAGDIIDDIDLVAFNFNLIQNNKVKDTVYGMEKIGTDEFFKLKEIIKNVIKNQRKEI